MDAADSIVVFLKAQTAEFNGKIRASAGEAEAFGQKGGSAFGTFSKFASGALLAVGAAALAVGAYGIKMADEYETAHARLETSVHNTGADFRDLEGDVAKTDKTMEAFGFTNADTESSLATLTDATHSARRAMDLETLAADIARGRHIDLASATGILVKVETGHVGLLGKLGIATKDATGKTISQEEAIKRLTSLYGGQAQAYTETFAGKVEVLKTKGADLAKNIGMALIPVIIDLANVGMGAVNFLESANKATDGWLGKLALFGVTGVLAVGAVSKLVAAGGAVKTWFSELSPAATGAAAGLGYVALGAAAVVGSIKLLEAIEPNFGEKLDKEAKVASDALQKTGRLVGDQATQINRDFGVSASAIDVYRDALLRGEPQQQAFNEAVKANAANGPDYTNELHLWTADVDKYVATLDPAARAQQLVTQAQQTYANELASAHPNHARLIADKIALTAASAKEAAITDKVTTATTADATAIKQRISALDKLGAVVGPDLQKVVDASKLTTDQITQLTEAAKQMDTDFSSAFDSATNVVDKFKDQSHVSFQAFITDELKSLAATQNWSTNIAQLAKDGIDRDFLGTLVKAGPASAGLVQSILDNVKHGSIGTINGIAKSEKDTKASTERTLNELVVGAAGAVTKINGLPPATVHVNVDHAQFDVGLAAVQAGLRGLGTITSGGVTATIHTKASAGGGRLVPGEWSTVGEQGTEWAYALPGGGVQIFPHGQNPSGATPHLVAHAVATAGASTSSGVTENHLHLHIHDGALVDAAKLEPVAVRALTDVYERNGQRMPWERR